MNDIERIKDAVLLLINTIYANSQEETQKQVLKSIKDILNTSQPEGYQGLNKWYLTKNGNIIFITSEHDNSVFGYGFCNGIWIKDFGDIELCIKRLATESEIKEAILKGCEQHGIVEGARVSHVGNRNCYFTVGDIKNFDYEKVDNSLWLDGNCLFDNGKFAEVVKQDNVQCIHPYPSANNTCLVCGEEMVKNFNCEDGNCVEQCDKCKDSFDTKPADKELLKECRIDFIQALGLCLNDTHLSERIRLRIKQINEALN